MFFRLSLPDRNGYLFTRCDRAFRERRVLERIARNSLVCCRMVTVVRAVPSVSPLTSVAVVVGRCGAVVPGSVVHPRSARGGGNLCARHVVVSRLRGCLVNIRSRWLSGGSSADALGRALGEG